MVHLQKFGPNILTSSQKTNFKTKKSWFLQLYEKINNGDFHKNVRAIQHWWANPSLGGTTRNITSQNFKTHPTSKQYRTHLKKTFQFKFYIKRLPKSFRI